MADEVLCREVQCCGCWKEQLLTYNFYLNFNDTPISRFECEKDLGVLVSSDLRPRAESIEVRNK